MKIIAMIFVVLACFITTTQASGIQVGRMLPMTERARGYYADPILVGTPSNPGESELVTGQLEIKMAGWYRTWYPAEGVALFEGNTPLVVLASPGLKVERSESGYRISAGSAREGWISAIFAADKDRAIWTLCFRVQFTGP